MNFNPLDPLGIGVSVSSGGFDNTAPKDYVTSYNLKSDPVVRRKAVSDIVKWLESHRGSASKPTHSYDEVLIGVKLDHVDQIARNELYKDLKANAKILAPDAENLQYCATHMGLFNIQDLSTYLAKFTHGIPEDELYDAYHGVKDDIATLLASKTIYSLNYIEKKKTILFPVIQEYAMQVDQDLKEMWNQVQMPKTEVELEERLHAAGHLSDTQYRAGHLEKSRLMQAQIKLAAGQKLLSQEERRAKRRRYPQKLTNVHLIGQYDWFNAPGVQSTKGGGAAGAAATASSSSTSTSATNK